MPRKRPVQFVGSSAACWLFQLSQVSAFSGRRVVYASLSPFVQKRLVDHVHLEGAVKRQHREVAHEVEHPVDVRVHWKLPNDLLHALAREHVRIDAATVLVGNFKKVL